MSRFFALSIGVAVAGLTAHAATTSRAAELIGRVPVRFEQNVGQWDSSVVFGARSGALRIGFTPAGAVLRDGSSAMRVAFSGGAATAPKGEQAIALRTEYRIGPRDRWRSGVKNFSRVRYESVYPGIDVVYYGRGAELEYDFELRPGADPSQIRIAFPGAARAALTASGHLRLDLQSAFVLQHKPVAYQAGAAGERREVAAEYARLEGGEFGLKLGAYDPSLPLTIDPVLSYAGLLGGRGVDSIAAIHVDAAGVITAGGTVTAGDLPSSEGAYQREAKGLDDIFIAIVDPSKQGIETLRYVTYFGGTGDDRLTGMVVDPAGFICFTGFTVSSDFPLAGTNVTSSLTGDLQPDAFLTRIDPRQSGADGLFYSTFIGGNEADVANGLAVDRQGRFYIVGTTRSGNFPLSDNAYARERWGNSDAFLTVVDTAASTPLVFSTFLGGEIADEGRAIALAPNGDVLIAGVTEGQTFPWSGQAYRIEPGGRIDGFVSRFRITNSGGDALVYSTYLGGSDWDNLRALTVDAQGRAIVTGTTLSVDFPVTGNALQGQNAGGGGDVFLTVLDTTAPSASALAYSTFLGGSGGDVAYAAAASPDGAIYLTGYTMSANFPVTPDAFLGTYERGVAAFVARLNPAAQGRSQLEYGTYLGRNSINRGNALHIMGDGRFYVAGSVSGATFPTANPYGGGLSDGFYAIFRPAPAQQ